MKYLPYLLVILVIATVNCRGYSTTGEELQGSDFTADPEPHYSQANSVADDGPRSTNGVSQDNGRNLVLDESVKILGNVQKRFLTGCPVTRGFFVHLNQCFKFINTPGTWYDAQKACQKEGLVLARPYETVALQKYIVLRYGGETSNSPHPVQSWIAGKSDGTCVRWLRGDTNCISPKLPLWWPGQPDVKNGNCLLLLANGPNWAQHPGKTLYSYGCINAGRYPLCELVLE